MPVRVHPGGLGETLGDDLLTGGPLIVAAEVWWVHHDGDDANDGREKLAPLATLAQAISNATSGDIIVCLDGHAETLTAPVVISKRLIIAGAGQSSSKPTVKFTPNMASDSMFEATVAGVELRNLWIEENLQANDEARIDVTAARFRMIGCYVECNGFDDNNALLLAATSGDYQILNTTFVSTATAASALPAQAVYVSTAAVRLLMKGVVFDGGTVGFVDGYAYEEAAAVTLLEAEAVSLLRGADMRVHDDTVGYVQTTTASRSPRVDWDGGVA